MSKIGQYYFDLTQSNPEPNHMYNNGDQETFFDECTRYTSDRSDRSDRSDDNTTDDIPF